MFVIQPGKKRAKVNRKKIIYCAFDSAEEKKAADHQISIQFEFVYSAVMTYNDILIEFCRYEMKKVHRECLPSEKKKDFE